MSTYLRSLILISLFILLGYSSFIYAANETNSYTQALKIVHKHFDAIGGLDKIKSHKSSQATGQVFFAGLNGTFKHWYKKPMQSRLEKDYKIFQQMEGDDGAFSWTVDANGKVLKLKDRDTIKRRKISALLEKFVHLDPNNGIFHLQKLGIQEVNGHKHHVIQMTNTINDDIHIDYFRTDNFSLTKSITKQPYLQFHTHYSDFRKVDGVVYAFREETKILPSGKEITTQYQSLKVNRDIDAQLFAIPKVKTPDFKFTKGYSSEGINFLLEGDLIYLPITIKDQTNYWVVDSGADMLVVDEHYAMGLGLKKVGKLAGSGTENLVQFSFVKLLEYQLPGIEFSSQKALSYKGLSEHFSTNNVVGILGFDFLSRFITKIDYVNNQLSFYHPEHFKYQGTGKIIDAPLKKKVFSVPMAINGIKGQWDIDIGSYDVSLNYDFAKQHHFTQQKGNIISSIDLGGEFEELQLIADEMAFDDYKVKSIPITIPLKKGKGSTSDAELAGRIGNSLLKHFIVYLDYKEQRIILEKNEK